MGNVVEKKLKKNFESIDTDGDGFISFEELKTHMHSIGNNLTDKEIKEMISVADDDNDHKINFQEFKKILA